MIFCKELNKSFPDKKAMFKELRKNAPEIIKVKKASLKNSEPVSYTLKAKTATKEDVAVSEITMGDYIYPIINTTNWLDSHGDVHMDNLWDVSLKDQRGRLYYIINHQLEIGKVIAYPDDMEAFVKTFNWTDLGQPYAGTTQALVFKVLLTDAAESTALAAIKSRKPLQNSVRMQYVSMSLCINDADPEFKQEYANFYKYLAVIANKEDAMEKEYFWAILEAKVCQEGSAVLFGSNSVTPILSESEFNYDPADASQKEYIDPADASQEKRFKYYDY